MVEYSQESWEELRKQYALKEEARRVRCFMDGIDWQHALGSAARGVSLYPSKESVLEHIPHIANGSGCGIVEVEVRIIRWVEEQDLPTGEGEVINEPRTAEEHARERQIRPEDDRR